MKFFTQYNRPPSKGESNNGITLVTKVPVKPLSVAVADSMMSGALNQAHELSYDFHSDIIPRDMLITPRYGMDIVEKLAFVDEVQNRVTNFKRSYYEEQEKKIEEQKAKSASIDPSSAIITAQDESPRTPSNTLSDERGGPSERV